MSLLEPSRSLGRWPTTMGVLAVFLVACMASGNAKVEEDAANGSRAPACLSQGADIDVLLLQLRRVGAAEERAAEGAMRDAVRAASHGDWVAASRGYGISMLCRPTVKALIGYSDASVLMSGPHDKSRESMDAALAFMSEAVGRYRLAIELGDRIGQPLPPAQRKEVESKIECLEKFLADPDPQRPPCQLVEDAMRTSKITGA